MTEGKTVPTGTTDPVDPADTTTVSSSRQSGIGRRGLLGAAGAGLLGGAALGYGGARVADGRAGGGAAAGDRLARAYELRGEHQEGITTPAQDCLFTGAFDVTTDDLEDLRRLMADWCAASAQMMAGELVGGEPLANPQAVPTDTGEAWGYPPSSLTITVGVGPTLFRTEDGADRFGLAARATGVLSEGTPKFANEAIQAEQSGGDLIVQACADDAQVAVHAIRSLARIGSGTVALRWTQVGQGRTSSTSTHQETPRNLFGFKDGTLNVKAEDGPAELDTHLWVQGDDEGGDWLAGGTYLVIRKIRMRLESWDRLRLIEQEQITGRDKRYGAPLSVADPASEGAEFTAPDYAAAGERGPAIPVDSHIAVVAPENNGGHRMLRRGYNYTEGSDGLGQLRAGLFFQAFVRDPRAGFYPILDRMTRSDALTEYLQHVATGLFAILPGVGPGDVMFGQKLLGAPGSGPLPGGAGASDAGGASDGGAAG
ncbi:Dyp-type peroxidase [Brachybacterium huguangmaarense]